MPEGIVQREGEEMAHATRHAGRGQQKKRRASRVRAAHLEQLNLNAAGIEVGANEHWVAVPADRDAQPVQRFGAFTAELYALAEWLRQCQLCTVVMESTGVYWIALFEVLEERGFDVKLVDAHQACQVPGRKTDVKDCQWLQELHTYGLLRSACRPADEVCVLRSSLRQRSMLVAMASRAVQHMQKALEQMHLKLPEVVSDITGKTVVYLSTADNSIGPKTRYNAPSHHTLEGARPWSRIFFTTNSLCWRSYGSSSCCISLSPSQACPPHPCRSSPNASVLPSPKRSRA